METEHVRTVRTEVHLLKIDGYSALVKSMEVIKTRSRWNIHGHEWEVRFYPKHRQFLEDDDGEFYLEWVALQLIRVSEPRRDELRVNLSCRFVCPSQRLRPTEEKSVSHVFDRHSRCSPEVRLMEKHDVPSSGYLVNDSLTMECTITVTGADEELPLLPVLPPPSDLHKHLGELLQSQQGADVTFLVSGESFAAHKLILAARSPVFKAEFFGGMQETSSGSVEIKDMEAAVFRSMLHFIYTDMAPDLEAAAPTMAQHLLEAADRYGLNRLKQMCECKLSAGVSIGTAATTLAFADQHNCSLLKANCVDFVTKSPETLHAVLATDGYAHLVASCPSVLAELLMAARGRRN